MRIDITQKRIFLRNNHRCKQQKKRFAIGSTLFDFYFRIEYHVTSYQLITVLNFASKILQFYLQHKYIKKNYNIL